MSSPIYAPTASTRPVRSPRGITPVAGKAETPAREGAPGGRSFADLLAEADAVRDLVDVKRRAAERPAAPPKPAPAPRGLQGTLDGATAGILRQPWLGLRLLRRRPAAGPGTARRPAHSILPGAAD